MTKKRVSRLYRQAKRHHRLGRNIPEAGKYVKGGETRAVFKEHKTVVGGGKGKSSLRGRWQRR